MTTPWIEITIPQPDPLAGTYRVKLVEGRIVEAEKRLWVPFGRQDLSLVPLLERLQAEARALGQHLRRAPWPDFAGKPITEGATIRHPSGEEGRVVFTEAIDPIAQWRVDYGDGAPPALLWHQIGQRGMAVVVQSSSAIV